MRNGRPPGDGERAALRESLGRNAILREVLSRARTLGLPQWYVAAGGVAQTVWNVATGRPAHDGIKDYDLIYHDAADLSWDAEDAVIRAGHEVFGDLPTTVEIRNQARVHLWYEGRFGLPCAALRSSEAAIDTFPATATCVGVRLEDDGGMRVYAPHGLSDVLNLIVRPNPVLAPRHIYERKVERWRRHWPELTVLPWPA
jgi:uncharacterized protein